MKRCLAFVALSLCLMSSLVAEAQSDQMRDDMRRYFRGEKAGGIGFMSIGAASAAVGGAFVFQDNEVMKGASIPILSLGGVSMLVGAIVFLRTDSQVESLEAQLESDPEGFKDEELTRMRGVQTTFTILSITELAFALGGVGLAIYGIVAEEDFWTGVGLGTAVEATALLLMDSLASQRANVYVGALEAFSPGAAAKPMMLHFSSSF